MSGGLFYEYCVKARNFPEGKQPVAASGAHTSRKENSRHCVRPAHFSEGQDLRAGRFSDRNVPEEKSVQDDAVMCFSKDREYFLSYMQLLFDRFQNFHRISSVEKNGQDQVTDASGRDLDDQKDYSLKPGKA